MGYVLIGGAVVMVGIYFANLYLKGDVPALVKALRRFVGGGLLVLSIMLAFTGRASFAGIFAIAGVSILWRGRLGPIDFTTIGRSGGAMTRVRSRLFNMVLELDSGAVSGTVISGQFSGRDLYDISEDEMRVLLEAAEGDNDSLPLLETWLDANRAGWREYLNIADASEPRAAASAAPMDTKQALEILGLDPKANQDDIKAAHRRLLKLVHPDQGGSTFLAARINEAKDFLIKGR